MFLEVWIEGERVGSYASEMAKAVSFTSQDPRDKALGKPELVLYTLNLDDYGYVWNLNLYCLWCNFGPELLWRGQTQGGQTQGRQLLPSQVFTSCE